MSTGHPPDDVGVREEIGDEVERVFREEGGCARGYRFVHEGLRRRASASPRRSCAT